MNPLDPAGNPRAKSTILERVAIKALNNVKAWVDSDTPGPMPQEIRMQIDLALMLYEQRRIQGPLLP